MTIINASERYSDPDGLIMISLEDPNELYFVSQILKKPVVKCDKKLLVFDSNIVYQYYDDTPKQFTER